MQDATTRKAFTRQCHKNSIAFDPASVACGVDNGFLTGYIYISFYSLFKS